jgi:hypothetical protein
LHVVRAHGICENYNDTDNSVQFFAYLFIYVLNRQPKGQWKKSLIGKYKK